MKIALVKSLNNKKNDIFFYNFYFIFLFKSAQHYFELAD